MAYRNVVNYNIYHTSVRSHKQKVQNLYKRLIRDIESWHLPDIIECRYQCILMRKKFEENRNIRDLRVAKLLLQQGEDYYNSTYNYYPRKFTTCPGGIAYNRYRKISDIVLDFWSPHEKAQYPDFFARREKLKEEYLKLHEEEYGDAKTLLGIEKSINYLEIGRTLDVSADPESEGEDK